MASVGEGATPRSVLLFNTLVLSRGDNGKTLVVSCQPRTLGDRRFPGAGRECPRVPWQEGPQCGPAGIKFLPHPLQVALRLSVWSVRGARVPRFRPSVFCGPALPPDGPRGPVSPARQERLVRWQLCIRSAVLVELA